MMPAAKPDDDTLATRRSLLMALSAIGATVAVGTLASGCAALEPGIPGESVDERPVVEPGTERVYRTLNGYNREQRSLATHRFSAEGSRLEGIDYDEAGSGGFGRPIARLIARQFNAEGHLTVLERADGSHTTFDPPLQVLPFPLVPRRHVRQDVFARDTGNPKPRRVIMITRVGRWETVTVPAGTFRALRVSRDLFMGDFEFHRTETQRREIDWYAPSAGAVVRASEDSEHQDLMIGRSPGGRASSRRGDWLIRELT